MLALHYLSIPNTTAELRKLDELNRQEEKREKRAINAKGVASVLSSHGLIVFDRKLTGIPGVASKVGRTRNMNYVGYC